MHWGRHTCLDQGPVQDSSQFVDRERSVYFLAIDEQAAALAAILDVVLSGFGDNRSAITRDAAVGKLQMIAGFGAPSDKEGHLCDANISPCAIGRVNA